MKPRDALLLDVYPALYPAGGIGRYVRDLANALATRPDAPSSAFVYPTGLRGASAPPWAPERLRPLPMGWRRMRVMLVASARLGWRPDALYGHPRVVHSPAGYGPIFKNARLLVTIHDLTGVLHPEWHPRRTSWLFQQTMPAAMRHAHRVVCDSEFVRQQVLGFPGVDPARVSTVHLGLSGVFQPMPAAAAAEHIRARFGIEGPFVLHVGTIEPRKNHLGLIEAFEALGRAGFPGPLVLVGQHGWRVESILRRLESSPLASRILRLTDASDRDLVALYSACTMFVFPSFEEGFGFPPLEAMACGAPVLSSLRSSLSELVKDAAVEIDPARPDGMGDAMIRMWKDEAHRAATAAAGPPRAAQFSQEQFVDRMFAIYRDVLGDNRSDAAFSK